MTLLSHNSDVCMVLVYLVLLLFVCFFLDIIIVNYVAYKVLPLVNESEM